MDAGGAAPILAGAGAALILPGDTVLGAVPVSGGTQPGQDDECAQAALAVLAPQCSPHKFLTGNTARSE
jgi:glc operon protein GlcG